MLFLHLFIMKVGQSLIAVPAAWREDRFIRARDPMSERGCEGCRLKLSFVGHATFGKRPASLDWNAIHAECDHPRNAERYGHAIPTGARFRPRAIREASTLSTFRHGGAYNHEDDATYLPLDRVRIVGLVDTDVVHTDMTASHANSELAVRTIIERGGFAGGTRRRPLDQYSMYPRLPRSRTDPCGADRCSTSSTSVIACARVASVQCAGRPKIAM